MPVSNHTCASTTNGDPPNLLFVCSRNQWRSRTAEALFRNDARFRVKSAGTAASARVRVNADHLAWADVIIVMEDKHREILVDRFGFALIGKTLTVLDIEDEYAYMDPALVEMLHAEVDVRFAATGSETAAS